jgi:hypothetical protein
MAVLVPEAVEVEMARSEVFARERPSIVSIAPGVLEAPIPRLPPRVKRRAVEVAVPLDEEEMVKSGFCWRADERPAMERLPQGDEVPIPSSWLVGSRNRKLAEPREVAPV